MTISPYLLSLVPACALLGGCSSMPHYFASTNRTVEMVHIFDLKTDAGTAAMSRAAIAGLGKHTVDIDSDMPAAATADLPDTPARFKLAGAAPGATLKVPVCDGAVWTARAQHSVSGTDRVNLYGCMYKYQTGYQLDTFATFVKAEGGWMRLPRYVRSKFSGTPEQWADTAVMDMVASMELAASARATHVEGQPALGGAPALATGQP